ncbi:hypothetical protein V2G26_003343 [Clonostachys chloroleuca]
MPWRLAALNIFGKTVDVLARLLTSRVFNVPDCPQSASAATPFYCQHPEPFPPRTPLNTLTWCCIVNSSLASLMGIPSSALAGYYLCSPSLPSLCSAEGSK